MRITIVLFLLACSSEPNPARECLNTQTDPLNCGACGHACASGEVCSLGTCATSCLGGLDECSGECVDESNDPAHCGSCDVACADGEVCANGTCATSCDPFTDCDGFCLDLNTDPNNCGACGNACPDGQFCVAGTCGVSNIQHVVLIVEENHTFDSYFGHYCQAPTGSNPTCTDGPGCCERAPDTEPSGAVPFLLDDAENESKDRDHDQLCEIAQIDGGAMDHYVVGSGITTISPIEYNCSDPHTWAVAESSQMATYWSYADNNALADRYFQPMAGGTSGNDMYFADAHWQFTDNTLRPNTIGTGCTGIGGTATLFDGRVTIADLLVNNGFSFRMYADGYADAVAAVPFCASTRLVFPDGCESGEKTPAYSACNYDPSDLPFQYYSQFADDPAHIVDSDQFFSDLSANSLPSFAYVKARTFRNEHPMWSTIGRGVSFVDSVVTAVEGSPYADSTLILLVWDEGGGFYDHVAPPSSLATTYDQDDGGNPVPYGTRVPMLAIGTFAKQGTVSHVQLEHSSVVRFLEYNFLGPRSEGALGNRDVLVNNIGSLLDPAKTGIVVP